MLRSFKAIRFGLMVGIGGGVPCHDLVGNKEDKDSEDEDSDEEVASDIADIRLGDVIISLHSKSSAAVVQYDFGKSIQGGEFIRTGTLNKPPNILLSAVSKLQAHHKLRGTQTLSNHLSEFTTKYPRISSQFGHPGVSKDRAFKAKVPHVEGKKSCKACCGPDDTNLLKREARDDTSPVLHYGTIGSADQVMKNSTL